VRFACRYVEIGVGCLAGRRFGSEVSACNSMLIQRIELDKKRSLRPLSPRALRIGPAWRGKWKQSKNADRSLADLTS
jgi:hypothetical protein